jgi:hypothetical protein
MFAMVNKLPQKNYRAITLADCTVYSGNTPGCVEGSTVERTDCHPTNNKYRRHAAKCRIREGHKAKNVRRHATMMDKESRKLFEETKNI